MSTQPWLLLYATFDGMQGLLSGVLRGIGRQEWSAAANLVGFGALGAPLSYYLATRTSMGLPGIWVGGSCAVITATIIMATAIARINWATEADKAHRRALAQAGAQ